MNQSNLDYDIYDFLMKEQEFRAKMPVPNLYMVPGSRDMYDFPIDFPHKFPKTQKEMALKKLLETEIKGVRIRDRVDFVFIDTPPNIKSLYIDNAFMAADYVISPCEAQPTSYAGVEMVVEIVKQFNEEWNPNLKFLGLIMNRVKIKTKLYESVRDTFYNTYGELLFETAIRDLNVIQEVNAIPNATITTVDEIKLNHATVKILKKNGALEDYEKLADEFLTRINK